MLKRFLVIFIIGLFVIPTYASAATEFKDVAKKDSHYPAIMALTDKGVISGYGDDTFRPGNKLSRAHAAVLFMNALEIKPLEGAELQQYLFSDVKTSHGYAGYIAASRKAGVFNGSEGKFLIDRDLTREQMATTIVNAFNLTNNGENKNINLDNVNASHKESVQILANYGITNQLSDFRPKQVVTRGQFATFLYQTMLKLGLIEEWVVEPEPGEKIINKSKYDADFSQVVDTQSNRTPKVDGAGRFIATPEAVEYYLNPDNFKEGSPEFFQFLLLSFTDSITAAELNSRILYDAGTLTNTGDAFLKAAKEHNVNVVYLIAHALHETGIGRSDLARGVEVGLDKNGNLQLVNNDNRDSLTDIKKTYNMFGISAVDSNPLRGGAFHAYNKGWFTPEAAILGGAEFITNNYIGRGQDTLYKMRWNPDQPGHHQYATHIMWATIQANSIYDMYKNYNLIDTVNLHFEVPEYKNQPGPTTKPSVADMYAANPTLKGAKGVITGSNVNFRIGPLEQIIRQLNVGTELEILGDSNGWYKVKVGGQIGWVIDDYVKLENMLKIINISTTLNVRDKPDGNVVGSLKNNELVVGIVDKDGNYVKEGDWYKIYFNGKVAYIHGDFAEEVK